MPLNKVSCPAYRIYTETYEVRRLISSEMGSASSVCSRKDFWGQWDRSCLRPPRRDSTAHVQAARDFR